MVDTVPMAKVRTDLTKPPIKPPWNHFAPTQPKGIAPMRKRSILGPRPHFAMRKTCLVSNHVVYAMETNIVPLVWSFLEIRSIMVIARSGASYCQHLEIAVKTTLKHSISSVTEGGATLETACRFCASIRARASSFSRFDLALAAAKASSGQRAQASIATA